MRVAHRPTRHLPLAALLVLALAACTSQPDDAATTAPPAAMGGSTATAPTDASPASSIPGDATAVCDASAAQSFVGREADDATVAEAKAAAGAGNVRVIKPGQPVTMDYSAERLNVSVDDGGVITSLNCG